MKCHNVRHSISKLPGLLEGRSLPPPTKHWQVDSICPAKGSFESVCNMKLGKEEGPLLRRFQKSQDAKQGFLLRKKYQEL